VLKKCATRGEERAIVLLWANRFKAYSPLIKSG
jgi:hypothetical protein